jgi:hypothetical protein
MVKVRMRFAAKNVIGHSNGVKARVAQAHREGMSGGRVWMKSPRKFVIWHKSLVTEWAFESLEERRTYIVL